MADPDRAAPRQPARGQGQTAARRARRRLALTLAGLLASWGSWAQAAEPRDVAVHLVGDADERQRVEEVFRERLASLDVNVQVDTPAQLDVREVLQPGAVQPGDLARVWIDLSDAERCTLYLTDGPWERILVRHFDRRGNPEVTAEELGHVLVAALDALLGGARIGVARESLAPAPPSPPAPPAAEPARPSSPAPIVVPARPTPSPWRVQGGAFYELKGFGPGPDVATGPGVLVQLEHRRRERVLAFQASGQWRLPASSRQISAEVELSGAALRGMALAGVRRDRWQMLGGLGGGVDATRAVATPIGPIRVTDPRSSVLPVLRAGAVGSVDTRWGRGFAGLGVDVPLGTTRYLLATPGGDRLLFAAWHVQPYLCVGVQTP